MIKKLKNKKGITLIEILAVVVVMGILTLLAVPSLSKFTRDMKMKSSARAIASNLRLARSLAITQNVNHFARIDLDANTISIMWNNGASDILVGKVWRCPASLDIYDIRNSSTNVTTGVYNLTFTPKGSATTMSLHLEKRNVAITRNTSASPEERAKCSTIHVAGTTGHVQVYSYGLNAPWSSTLL